MAVVADIVTWTLIAVVAVLSPVLGWRALDGLTRALGADLRDEPDAGRTA